MVRTENRMSSDDTWRGLLIANVVTAAFAIYFHWTLADLLWPYWIQSVIIGWFSRKRILALKGFDVAGVRFNDKPVTETPDTKRNIANFFALHYGIFHLVYLFFLLTRHRGGDWRFWLPILGAGVAFAVQQSLSYRQTIDAITAGRPNIGTMMALPYLRIVPMHAAILSGVALTDTLNLAALALFTLLKTVADIGMQVVAHRWLMTARPARPSLPRQARDRL